MHVQSSPIYSRLLMVAWNFKIFKWFALYGKIGVSYNHSTVDVSTNGLETQTVHYIQRVTQHEVCSIKKYLSAHRRLYDVCQM